MPRKPSTTGAKTPETPPVPVPAKPLDETTTTLPPAPEPNDPTSGIETRDVQITIPLATKIPAKEHMPRHLDVQLVEPEQRRAVKALHIALDRGNVRTVAGRPIVSYADTIRWLIEQITMAASKKTT